jgi:ribosomal protein S18 acetylase RimI-like enzyme
MRAIELQVEERNQDAQRFYGKLGFKHLSRMAMTLDL